MIKAELPVRSGQNIAIVRDVTGRAFSARIKEGSSVVEVVRTVKNGCCPGLPVLVAQRDAAGGGPAFFCQCACGGKATDGHGTAQEAAASWARMTGNRQHPRRGRIRVAVQRG